MRALLSNIRMYDYLLKLTLPEVVTLVGFADDAALVIVRRQLEEIPNAFST